MDAVTVERQLKQITPLIYRFAGRFVNLYGGELEDVASDLRLYWLKMLSRYDPKKGALTTYTYNCLRGKTSHLRRVFDRRPPQKAEVGMGDIIQPEKAFDLNEFADSLSADGWEILKLIFEPPPALLMGIPKKMTPKRLGEGARNYLQRILGWNLERVTKGFQEIKEALQ